MITEWLISLGTIVSGWVSGLFPDFVVPPFIRDFAGGVSDLLSNLTGVAVWADWSYIIGVVSVVTSVWAACLAWRGLRMLLSHIPLFGGGG